MGMFYCVFVLEVEYKSMIVGGVGLAGGLFNVVHEGIVVFVFVVGVEGGIAEIGLAALANKATALHLPAVAAFASAWFAFLGVLGLGWL
jgi:hypothetical protein